MTIVRSMTIVCYHFFNQIMQEEQDREINEVRRYPNGTVLSFPVNSAMIDNILRYNPEIFNISDISQHYNSIVEVHRMFVIYCETDVG